MTHFACNRTNPKRIARVLFMLTFIVTACSESSEVKLDDLNAIEIVFEINSYSSDDEPLLSPGTGAENQINELFVYLFPTHPSQSLLKFYMNSSDFAEGSWVMADNKVMLDKTNAEVGQRLVYVVANAGSLKSQLDLVTTPAELELVFRNIPSPWSPALTTPLLMSGSVMHDFIANYRLTTLSLTRAIAKLHINIQLSNSHRGPLTQTDGSGITSSQYHYRLLNFDTRTYSIKPLLKPDYLVSSGWVSWESTPTLSAVTLDGSSNVSSLSLTTYLNERDNAGTVVEFKIPYYSTGSLPPPEFGNETFRLVLPDKIIRNTFYSYLIEL